MAKVMVSKRAAKKVSLFVGMLQLRGWENVRLVVPSNPNKRARIKAVAASGMEDIGLEVLLSRRFGRLLTKVFHARKYGPGKGQVWGFGSEKPFPTVLQAELFLRERLKRGAR